MAPKLWEILNSRWDRSYRVFNLRTDHARSPRTGLSHDFFVLEASDWVNIIPLTPDQEVVLIRQYRHGIRDNALEIPGGLLEADDSLEGAARRELAEETGYSDGEMTYLGYVHPNPAILNNRCHTFLARDVVLNGDQDQDDREDIEVILYPLSEIPRLIYDNQITHALVLAAFYRLFMEKTPSDLGDIVPKPQI